MQYIEHVCKTNKMHALLPLFVSILLSSTCFEQTSSSCCTYSNRHLSNRYCCLLASRQQYLFDSRMYSLELLMMDGRTVRNM